MRNLGQGVATSMATVHQALASRSQSRERPNDAPTLPPAANFRRRMTTPIRSVLNTLVRKVSPATCQENFKMETVDELSDGTGRAEENSTG